jgi:Putative Zn-dependent protease, contains TPR repeats
MVKVRECDPPSSPSSSQRDPQSQTISHDEIEEALRRILQSDPFLRSERLSRFLSYVVQMTLKGEQGNLKEYHLGVEVCGRKDGYDPRTDPVVRVEARRLRTALDLYYAHEGTRDNVRISLHKGGYVPSFSMNGADHPDETAPEVPRTSFIRRSQWQWYAAALVGAFITAGAVGTYSLWKRSHTRPAGDVSTIVLADFTNTTGETIFDHALRQGLAAQLEQSPYLSFISDAQVAQTLALMGKPKDAHLTADLAREVCERTGKSVVVDGSISSLGSEYVLGLSAMNCHTGEILATEQMQASGKEHVLAVLAKGATDLRHKLGESLASVQKYDAPPENVTTPSLEALQDYGLGFQIHVVKLDERGAAQLFQRAIEVDPKFAMAYARLAVCDINLGELEPAADLLRKAHDLSAQVSEHERLFILSLYHEFVTGDLEEARKTYEVRAQIFPHDDIPIGNAGNVYFLLGHYDKALDATQEALRRNPGSRIWNGNLVDSYLALQRIQEAKSAAVAAKAHDLESPWLHIALYLIAYEEGNQQAMELEAKQVREMGEFEDILLYYQAQAKAREGNINESRALSMRAVDLAMHDEQRDSASLYLAQAALNEAWAGNAVLARQTAQRSLRIPAGRDGEAVAGVALALAGDSTGALRIAGDLTKRFPENTMVREDYVPVIRAAAALRKGSHIEKPQEVIDMLAPASQIELGSHAMERVAFLTCYPIYFRGEALLAAHQGAQAAAEFQKILDHPQLTLTDPVSSMALLALSRAYEMSGDRTRSVAAYKRFSEIWRSSEKLHLRD